MCSSDLTVEPSASGQPTLLVPDALRSSGAILVNEHGNRFFDETSAHDYLATALLEQPNALAWLVFDAAVRQANPFVEVNLEAEGLVRQAANASELASAIGVPAQALQQTIDSYNAVAGQGAADGFGRTRGAVVLAEPLYAVKVGVDRKSVV